MSSQPLYEYSVLGEIHYLRLMQSTGPAVRSLLEHVERNIVGHPINGKNRVLIDFRPSGPPNIIEGMPLLISFLRRQPKDPLLSVRVAYLYNREARSRILTGFLNMQRFLPQGISVKFFSDTEYEQALEWLHA